MHSIAWRKRRPKALGWLAICLGIVVPGNTHGQTLFAVDEAWSTAGEWKIYKSRLLQGCYAEATQTDGSTFLIGIRGAPENLLLGLFNDRLDFAVTGEPYKLKLVFDGKRSWDTTFNTVEFGSRRLLIGNYSDASEFTTEIARSNSLKVSRGNSRLANLSLRGSSAVFELLKSCNGSDVASPSASPDLAHAAMLRKDGVAALDKKLFNEAEAKLVEALAIRERLLGESNELVTEVRNDLNLLYNNSGDYKEAELMLTKMLSVNIKHFGQESKEAIDTKSRIAETNVNLQKYETAAAIYGEVAALEERLYGRESFEVSWTLNLVGWALRLANKYDEAEIAIERAIAIGRSVYQKKIQAKESVYTVERKLISYYTNLALVLRGKKNYDMALAVLESSLIIAEKNEGKNSSLAGGVREEIGDVLRLSGKKIEATKYYEEALRNSEKYTTVDDHIVVQGFALDLLKAGRVSEAEAMLQRAVSIGERRVGADHPDVADTLYYLGDLLHRRHRDYLGAEPLYRRALVIREMAFGKAHPKVGVSLNTLADLLVSRRNFAGSLEFARRAYLANHYKRGTYFAALYGAGNPDAATIGESLVALQSFSNSSSGKALRNLAVRFAAGGGDLADLVREEQDAGAELQALNSVLVAELSKAPEQRDNEREAGIRDRIASLTGQLGDIHARLTNEFPDFVSLSAPEPVTLEEVQGLLKEDEALVVIDITEKGTGDDYVWAITSGGAIWTSVLANGLDVSLARLRASLDLADRDRPAIDLRLAHLLYQRLLSPVSTQLAGKNHLLFVLNGSVSSLPPQVLVTQAPANNNFREAKWLVRDHAISILPTVSSLKLLRSQTENSRATKPFIGYGDPVFDASREQSIPLRASVRSYTAFFEGARTKTDLLRRWLPRLPATGLEVAAVGQSQGASDSDIRLRENASEAGVKKAKLDQYNIVYFATHGLVAGEVEQVQGEGAEPALAFSIPEKPTDLDDGLLTASEVAQLRLNADWVVMSACNTAAEGRPGAEALSGLARAFFYAGARALLVTHWVVDDEGTAELMERTFRYASKNPNQRAAEALRQAMISIMNDNDNPHWADPGYWAPFVLVGEPRLGG